MYRTSKVYRDSCAHIKSYIHMYIIIYIYIFKKKNICVHTIDFGRPK